MISATLKTIIIDSCIVIAFISVLGILIKNIRSYEYEKKFSNFAFLSVKDTDVSFLGYIDNFKWQVVYFITNILRHSKVIENHSKVYEQDISPNVEDNLKEPLNFIAIKIMIGNSIALLYLLTVILGHLKFNIMNMLVVFILGYLFPNIIIKERRRRRQERIQDDLLKAIIIMNNCFKTGKNIMQAIKTVELELEGPISEEFKKISLDISYGLSIDTVFTRFYNRVKVDDAKYIASSLMLLNKTGGNIVKVFSLIENTFFEKKKLRNELRSLTSSSTFVFRVLVAMPIIFSLVIAVLNKDYFKPFFSSIFGMFVLLIIISLYILYILIIRKVIKVRI